MVFENEKDVSGFETRPTPSITPEYIIEISYYFIKNSTQLGNDTEILTDITGNYYHGIDIVMNIRDIIENQVHIIIIYFSIPPL